MFKLSYWSVLNQDGIFVLPGRHFRETCAGEPKGLSFIYKEKRELLCSLSILGYSWLN